MNEEQAATLNARIGTIGARLEEIVDRIESVDEGIRELVKAQGLTLDQFNRMADALEDNARFQLHKR